MSNIIIENFSGIAPKIPPTKLVQSGAQVASNVRLERGRLTPLRARLDDAVIDSDVESIFYYPYRTDPTDYWMTYEEEAHIVYLPIVDPTSVTRRICITDEHYPKIRSGESQYRLGIPAPTVAPSVSVDGGNVPDPADPNEMALAEDIIYVYTYVDGFGYEGPPSPPSTAVTHLRNTDVDVWFTAALPSGVFLTSPAVKRLYRSNTGNSATDLQFVADIAIGANTEYDDPYIDQIDNDDLQETLPSETWIGPPDDNTTLYPTGPMTQIVNMAGGVMAGFTGTTVCLSEPYLPHAWPLAYRSATPDDIVGISPLPEGLAVLTQGKPTLLIGSHPGAMSQAEIPGDPQVCVSRASIVDMGGITYYASNNGICSISMQGVQNLTEGLFTALQWHDTFNPSTIKAFLYEGRYVATYDTGSVEASFVFDPRGENNAFVTGTETFDCFWRDDNAEEVHIKYGTVRGTWENNPVEDNTYTWRSKIFNNGRRVAYTVCKLRKEAGTCTVNLYGDGSLIQTKDCTSVDLFRIVSGAAYSDWEVEIVGTAHVDYVALADNMTEVP